MPASAFPRTLLVGFETEPAARLETLLRRHGHEVTVVTAAGAKEQDGRVNLLLVAAEALQDVADLAVQRGNPAVLAVSEQDSEDERLRVLRAGCDDHVPLDCGPVELMARVDAVLRWVAVADTGPTVIEHGPLRIDTRDREVQVEGRAVHLTRKEYELLRLLAGREGDVVDRAEVLERIWHQQSAIVGRTLDTHVSSIRRKIGKWACVTVKGYGLRIGQPEEEPNPPPPSS